MIVLDENPATGGPGADPRWTRSAKDGVGTAYSASSRIWFTLSEGILNEVYFPTIDQPQIRDLRFAITDGKTFLHDERRDLDTTIEYLSEHALGFRVTKSDRERRYRIVKEVIADPHAPAVLVHTKFEANAEAGRELRLFALLEPHLDVGGRGNNANVVQMPGREILTAHKNNVWLAFAASGAWLRRSCGYVGSTDGWTDLSENLELDWQFDSADAGNLMLIAEVDLTSGAEFTLAIAFGDSLHSAVTTLSQALGVPFPQQRDRFIAQWERPSNHEHSLTEVGGDKGTLYCRSHSLILAHEDKRYHGAFIASLSIPWGEAKGDEDYGAYHLVWTRDMCNSTTGLLAAGNTTTPLRALIYLACAQKPDGGFPQNFWIRGQTAWGHGIQLDEVSFPIMLAWRLHELGGLGDFDPYPMVKQAASFLVRNGPATNQERWEDSSGYSPSTLAANIAALICASLLARERGDEPTAKFLEEYADFLASHVEQWTVTSQGTLLTGVHRHFIRILPVATNDVQPNEDPDNAILSVPNQPPGQRKELPAKEIVDPGFLELVRYGIRRGGDPLIEDSLRVVDAILKIETPFGPCWHRYSHDGYGEHEDDAAPFDGWGKGRAWPLLTGERGHYELAAGRDPMPYVHALEAFASATGLLPEQVWDETDRPEAGLFFGKPTGSAMPLVWAHAEYIKLLRSISDGKIFDLIPAVAERYLGDRRACAQLEVWKPNRQVRSIKRGLMLRIQAPTKFRLRWSLNEWRDAKQSESNPTALGVEFVDFAFQQDQRAPLRFTFFWPAKNQWEGKDYAVAIEP